MFKPTCHYTHNLFYKDSTMIQTRQSGGKGMSWSSILRHICLASLSSSLSEHITCCVMINVEIFYKNPDNPQVYNYHGGLVGSFSSTIVPIPYSPLSNQAFKVWLFLLQTHHKLHSQIILTWHNHGDEINCSEFSAMKTKKNRRALINTWHHLCIEHIAVTSTFWWGWALTSAHSFLHA